MSQVSLALPLVASVERILEFDGTVDLGATGDEYTRVSCTLTNAGFTEGKLFNISLISTVPATLHVVVITEGFMVRHRRNAQNLQIFHQLDPDSGHGSWRHINELGTTAAETNVIASLHDPLFHLFRPNTDSVDITCPPLDDDATPTSDLRVQLDFEVIHW